ncbi:MAG: hypothetical protein ABJA64_02315 [Candidatus Saccharibacteria bacterium]
MNQTTINKQVNITAMGFKKNLMAYPCRMEFEGRTYSFIDSGLSCIVRQGERIAQILTMSDGHAQFRLRSDNRGGIWTLISMSS